MASPQVPLLTLLPGIRPLSPTSLLLKQTGQRACFSLLSGLQFRQPAVIHTAHHLSSHVMSSHENLGAPHLLILQSLPPTVPGYWLHPKCNPCVVLRAHDVLLPQAVNTHVTTESAIELICPMCESTVTCVRPPHNPRTGMAPTPMAERVEPHRSRNFISLM